MRDLGSSLSLSSLVENTNFSNNQFQFLNYRVGRGNSAITVNSAIYGSFTQPMCEYFQSHIFTEGPVVQLLAVDQVKKIAREGMKPLTILMLYFSFVYFSI